MWHRTSCYRFRIILWLIACLLFLSTSAFSQLAGQPADANHQPDEASLRDVNDFNRDDQELLQRRQESFVMWMIRCLGPFAILLPVVGLFCFILTLIIVIRGNGPFAAVALILIVPIPFWLGTFGGIQGLVLSLQVIATTTVAPKPYQVADGIATSLFSPMVGLIAMMPSYLLATAGSLIRSLLKDRQLAQPKVS